MIDELDRKILRHLQKDASTPLEDLGEKIGLSRNAIWRRVKKLSDDGTIKARVALLDPTSVGVPQTVFISVKAPGHSAGWTEKFAALVRQTPAIQSAWRTAGVQDYLIKARVRDVADYDRLYKRLVEKIEMAEVTASFVMEDLKESTELPL